MSLQRKCFTASAVAHGLVILLVLVGSAFIPQKPVIEGPSFELFTLPEELIDDPNRVSGGNPLVTEPPAPAPVVQQPVVQQPLQPVRIPEPDPPKPEPVKPQPREPAPQPERVERPEPKVEEPDPFDFSKVRKVTPKNTPKPAETSKPDNSFDLSKVEKRRITPRKTTRSNSRNSNAPEQSTQVAKALTESMSRVRGNLSSVGGSYDIPGPGGAAYASYHLAIRKIFEDAWIPPTVSRGNEPKVEVEVVIRRDGTVLEGRILQRSGHSTLDRTVDTTLKRVKKVPPFPAGSTDERRTFRFNFNLIDKLSN